MRGTAQAWTSMRGWISVVLVFGAIQQGASPLSPARHSSDRSAVLWLEGGLGLSSWGDTLLPRPLGTPGTMATPNTHRLWPPARLLTACSSIKDPYVEHGAAQRSRDTRSSCLQRFLLAPGAGSCSGTRAGGTPEIGARAWGHQEQPDHAGDEDAGVLLQPKAPPWGCVLSKELFSGADKLNT